MTVPSIALPRSLAPAFAALALAGLVASGVLLCLHAAAAPSGLIPASWRGMPGWMAGPLPGVGDGLTAATFSALFIAMCGCYLVTLVVPLDVRLTVGAIVVLHAAFLLAPPLLSSDVFGYIHFGRPGASHDPALAYFRWRTDLPNPYGPAFTLFSYATAPLGAAGAFWAMKVACAAASLGCVALVASCARRLGADPVRAAAF